MQQTDNTIITEITEKVKFILSKTAEDGLQWTGTKTDLLELLHKVYVYNTITMPDGTIPSFSYLVDQTFSILHLVPLKNPYARTRRAVSRKGMRQRSITDRLQYIISSADDGRKQRFWNTLIINAC